MDLDKKLLEVESYKRDSLGRIISCLKRQFDQWTLEELARHGYDDIKIMHMLFLMNINPEGTSNGQLAKHALVTKQAMSKVTKELQELGYIQTKIDPEDKRSTILILTNRGKNLVITTRMAVMQVMEEYKEWVGKQEFETTINTLLKIIDINNRRI